jgi:hypothetical protein
MFSPGTDCFARLRRRMEHAERYVLGTDGRFLVLQTRIFWWKYHRGTGADNSVFCTNYFTNARYWVCRRHHHRTLRSSG